MQRILIAIAVFSLITLSSLAQKDDKRRIGLLLMQQYSPESLHLIKQVEELSSRKIKGVMMMGNSDFTSWLSGNTEEKIVEDIGTAVHEVCHSYTFKHPIMTQSVEFGADASSYYLDSENTIVVNHTEVVNSYKIGQKIPANLRTFRFDVYLEPKQSLSAQKDGVYGLLNEWTAYYNGSRMNVDLFDYYLERSKDEGIQVMLDYISNLSSTVMAHYEFRFYTLFYLKTVKTTHPDVYRGIMQNQKFLELFLEVDKRFNELIQRHEQNKLKIIENANKQGINVSADDDYFFIGNRGAGLFMEDTNKLIQEMEKPEYQMVLSSISASR